MGARIEQEHDLGGMLRALRVVRQLTQAEVGEKAGFTGKYISEIERGHRDPPFSTLVALVELGLDAQMSDLFSTKLSNVLKSNPSTRAAQAVARDISALPVDERRKVLHAVRAILALTQ